jgi:ribosomal protein L11 methyltransferase
LAKKLGAEQMVGVDTDELAVKTAVANAHQNNTQITFQMGTLTSIQQKGWDVVVVNILAPIIIGMLLQDELMRYVRQDGRLILSGIIDQQMVDVETAVRQAGGEISQILTVRDWVCFIIKQKTPTN